MKQEKGITLITLVITIIVLLILAGTITYSGIESIQTSKRAAFISELEMIQAKVNTIYEKRKLSEQEKAYYDTLGQDISVIEIEHLHEILKGDSANGFRYFPRQDLTQFELENIGQDIILNFETRQVISVTGIKIEGIMYYRLQDILGYTMNHITYSNQNTKAPTFLVQVMKLEDKWRFTLNNIEYHSNVEGGTVSYKLHEEANWILNNENTSFEVTSPGLYDIRLTDKAGNSTIKQEYIYITEGLIAWYDGENNTGVGHDNTTTTWRDLSGNNQDIFLYNFNNTENSGWQKNSLSFDGIDDYVFNNTLKKTKDITIEIIFNSKDNSGTRGLVGWTSYRSDDPRVGIYIIDNVLYKYSANMSVELGAITQYNFSTNAITSTALTTDYNRRIFCDFINGEIVNILENVNISDKISRRGFAIGSYGSRENVFGQDNYKGKFLLVGNVYSVRIYNRALTQKEIHTNYQIDKLRFGIGE